MTRDELRTRRLSMGKTQRQLADLMGISLRAVHSFEQGWRKIPIHVERQVYFLAMLARRLSRPAAVCWQVRRCPVQVRRRCPAWELKAGQFCWFISGTLCQGASRQSWKAKMAICRRCAVFLGAVGPGTPSGDSMPGDAVA